MKSLIAFLFTLSLSATASEYPDDPSKLLEQIVTCKISHLDLKESTIAQRKLENLFTNILIKDDKKRAYIPNQKLKVFGFNVVKALSSFGMNPGFMVELESSMGDLKNAVEEAGNIVLDDCDSTMKKCGKKLSKTDFVAVLEDGDSVFLGCKHPYRR